jgi:hypothetical protein
MTQIKKEMTEADPHLMPLDTINTSRDGNALNISMMLENSQTKTPRMRTTDQIS